MPITLGDAIVYFKGDLTQLVTATAAAEKGVKGSANAMKGSLTELLSAWNLLKQGAGMAAQALQQTVGAWAAWGDQAMDMQYQLGGTVESLSGFAGAAKMVGMDVSEVSGSLRILMNNTGQLANDLAAGKEPAGEFADALKRMGIDARTFASLGFVDQIGALADGLNTLPAGAQRTTAGVATLGRGFYAMTDLLEGGRQGLQDYVAQAKDAGLVLTEAGARAAEQTDLQAKRIAAAWEGIGMKVGAAVGPFVEDVLTFGEKLMAGDFLNAGRAIFTGAQSTAAAMHFEAESVKRASAANVVYTLSAHDVAMRQRATAAETKAAAGAMQSYARVTALAASQAQHFASLVGKGSVGRQEYIDQRIAAWEAAQGGGGGGTSPMEARLERERAAEFERARAARQAGYDVSRWRREQYDQLADNEAGLTAEVQQEYAARTEAAYNEALKVKDNDQQLAADILANEQSYQEKKAEIMQETDETVRAAKLAQLERDYSQEQGDMAERARLREEERKAEEARQQEQDVANARATGSAAGEAMAKTFGAVWDQNMAQQAERWTLLQRGAEEAAIRAAPAWARFLGAVDTAQDTVERKWKTIETAATAAGVNAQTAWGWAAQTGGGYPIPTPAGSGGGEKRARGGPIWEPVVGRGVRSGKRYDIAESGPENVEPMNTPAAAGGEATIVVQLLGPIHVGSQQDARDFGENLGYGLRMSLRSQGVAS